MSTQALPPPIPSCTPTVLRKQKPPPENKPSLLLSLEENRTLFSILGSECQTLATAVVQLAMPISDGSYWQRLDTGVVCLVRDENVKSYYIEVISLMLGQSIFSQEVYNEFDYKILDEVFVYFEGDDCMVGLNFADRSEMGQFCEALNKKIKVKRQRRDAKRRSMMPSAAELQSLPQSSPISEVGPFQAPSASHTTIKIEYGTIKKVKKGKINKSDIGAPMDFRHIQHVGFDKTKGLDFNLTDVKFQAFFDKVGISADELQDENTQKFIQNFIKKHGGVEAIKKIGSSSGKMPHSPVAPPRPPPPSQLSGHGGPTTPDDFDDLPLPPPPPGFDDFGGFSPTSPFPNPPSFDNNAQLPPPPPFPPPFLVGGDGLPPPPPLPPAFSDDLDGLPPPPPLLGISGSTARLKPAASRAPPPMDLFQQIKLGAKLKPVQVADTRKSPARSDDNDLAGALRDALKGFRNDVRPSDSEDDNDLESDDDNWD